MESPGNVLDDQRIKDWLNGISNHRTKVVYSSSIRTFFNWLGQSPSDFIKAIDEDSRLPVTERRNLARQKLLEFYNYATTEMPNRNPHKNVQGKGLSYQGAIAIVAAVRSLLNEYGITVKFARRHAPKPKGRNPCERLRLNAAQVRSILSNARLPRDRAIIIMLAQSGMDITTLTSMAYKDVSAALADDAEAPVILEMFRQKASKPYFTFMGSEGIDAIKVYAQDLKQRGVEPKPDDPLWLTDKGKAAMSPANVQKMLRICAEKAGLVNGEDRFNIAGGHALREFFSSTLNEVKVPKAYIDEMLGHTLDGMDSAYFQGKPDQIKMEYARAYESIMLQPQGLANGTLQKKIDEKVDEKVSVLLEKINAQEKRIQELETSIKTEIPRMRELLNRLNQG